MDDGSERLRRLADNADAVLSTETPWIVVAAAPTGRPASSFDATSGDQLRAWVRRQVEVWPAPIPLGTERPQVGGGNVTFAPTFGKPTQRYFCQFNADGSALIALPAGVFRDSPADGARVWAIGEGAIAWITLALLRLAAAYADHASVLGEAMVQMTVTSEGANRAAPIEVWNHNNHAYGPAGSRIAGVAPRPRSVDLASCLSADLARTARPLVIDALRQFGLAESRQINPIGVIQLRNFTGYDDVVLAWTDAIGIPSQR